MRQKVCGTRKGTRDDGSCVPVLALPALIDLMARSACLAVSVAMSTASTSGLARSSSEEEYVLRGRVRMRSKDGRLVDSDV
jgi:hypothetical protein